MIRITIEGKNINCEEDFHAQIASLLNFPNYYGKNLDALWDCITDWALDHRSHQIIIEWRDHLKSKNILGERYFLSILDVFNDLKKDWQTDVLVELK